MKRKKGETREALARKRMMDERAEALRCQVEKVAQEHIAAAAKATGKHGKSGGADEPLVRRPSRGGDDALAMPMLLSSTEMGVYVKWALALQEQLQHMTETHQQALIVMAQLREENQALRNAIQAPNMSACMHANAQPRLPGSTSSAAPTMGTWQGPIATAGLPTMTALPNNMPNMPTLPMALPSNASMLPCPQPRQSSALDSSVPTVIDATRDMAVRTTPSVLSVLTAPQPGSPARSRNSSSDTHLGTDDYDDGLGRESDDDYDEGDEALLSALLNTPSTSFKKDGTPNLELLARHLEGGVQAASWSVMDRIRA